LEVGPVGAATPAAGELSLRARLENVLKEANVPLGLRGVLALTAGLGMTAGASVTLVCGPLIGILGAALAAAAPLLYLRARGKARREKILAQLPNAFDLMARVIRSGNSVTQALQAVVDAFEGPLATEFASCQQQQNLGLRPEITFHE